MRILATLAIVVFALVATPDVRAQALLHRSCETFVKIGQTASTQLVVGVAGKKIGICALVIWNGATAQSVSLVEGTGTTCATGTAGIVGNTTASLSLPASNGFAMASDLPFLITQTAGDALCLLQSGTTNVSGVIAYGQF